MENKAHHACLGIPGCNHPIGQECNCRCHTESKGWEERFDRLELDDEGSKGCSVCLAEKLSRNDYETIKSFISQLLTESKEIAEHYAKTQCELVKMNLLTDIENQVNELESRGTLFNCTDSVSRVEVKNIIREYTNDK